MVFIFLNPYHIIAQQNPKYTQYMYNTSIFNPAYIGSKQEISFFGLYSSQWVGLEGAPKITNLSFSSPLSDNGLAVGINYTNDQTGAIKEDNISLNIAYDIELNRKYRLSFGLKSTANLFSIDYNKLNIKDPNDPISQTNINNKFSPNMGVGLFAYSENSYLGVSIPELFETNQHVEDKTVTMSKKTHLHILGGHLFDINYNTIIKPSFLLKMVDTGTVQLDLTVNAYIFNKYTLGLAYSTNSSISALVGFNLDPNWFIGYSISGQANDLKKTNSASHEIFMRYEIPHKNKSTYAPRFF